jgi:hypothetical protein
MARAIKIPKTHFWNAVLGITAPMDEPGNHVEASKKNA